MNPLIAGTHCTERKQLIREKTILLELMLTVRAICDRMILKQKFREVRFFYEIRRWKPRVNF